ncbi:MAG TPA: hypothetical protein PLD20_26585 [Blastocatellia bacterium]|nr:hypothetical protein [Blastocatellia bacterium]HMX28956.1 hypothetical protein [Blastocatellia bacterium]HMY72140.1 hypothetical protein [Blastocatellia bacterium]HMZ21529.1 hypothetical protein [Blastocatellia bacterium]HNG29731.1 hypothetical protein [Blastocatellia bacterium]
MAKTHEQNEEHKGSKDIKPKKSKEEKATKEKNGNALVGRVKKVVKKSRRKMGDEKFEKQLQRTIAFLEELQLKLAQAPAAKADKREKKKTAKQANGKAGNSHAKPKPKTKASSVIPAAAQSGKTSSGK